MLPLSFRISKPKVLPVEKFAAVTVEIASLAIAPLVFSRSKNVSAPTLISPVTPTVTLAPPPIMPLVLLTNGWKNPVVEMLSAVRLTVASPEIVPPTLRNRESLFKTANSPSPPDTMLPVAVTPDGSISADRSTWQSRVIVRVGGILDVEEKIASGCEIARNCNSELARQRRYDPRHRWIEK